MEALAARPADALVLDVREPQEYAHGHVPGAINLPLERVQELAPDVLPNKDAEVIVYCASAACHASENAARTLAEMGYSNVRRYVGGKQDWIDAGLPVVSDEHLAA